MASSSVSSVDCIERIERFSISPRSLRELETQLENLYNHLSTHQALIDSHLVSFFTENLWDTRLPTEWKDELEILADDQLTLLSFGRVREIVSSPSLIEFVEKCHKMSLASLGVPDFQRILNICSCQQTRLAMGEKKRHEVSQMTNFVRYLINAVGVSQVIDIGSGRGYLSEAIALDCRLKVIGLDSSEGNTCSAEKRNKLFERVLRHHFEQTDVGSVSSYLPVTVTVDTQHDVTHSFLDQLARQHPGILDTTTATAVVGLHTCGQLACTIQNIFLDVPQLKLLVYISCCYHLMHNDTGFPQSSYLKTKRATLSRTARNYCQTPREQTGSTQHVKFESIFYRAALQWIIKNELGGHTDHLQIGKLYGKSQGFVDYVEKALQQIGMHRPDSLTAEKIRKIHDKLKPREKHIRWFSHLQTLISTCVESVILLDRLCHLMESDSVANAFIIPLFDERISPRNKAIVAFKK